MGAVAELLVVLGGGCELTAVTTDDGMATIGARCGVRLPPERIVVWVTPADERAEPAVAALG